MSAVFDPLYLAATALDVMACTHAAPFALAARQKSRLAKLLDFVKRESPLYRERLRGVVTGTAAVNTLPRVPKDELMARFDDWVTDPQLKVADLRAFTGDPERMGQSYFQKYMVWESSGTSHRPGIFVQDARAMAVYDALEALRRSTPRLLPSWFAPWLMQERIAFVGVTTGHFASMVSMLRLQQINPVMAQSLRCFSILQSAKALLDELNDYAPSVIATYPSVATMLAEAAAGGLIRFRPKEIWTGGETLSAGVRQRVTSALGCEMRNSYGASEFLSMAWECGRGRMHVNADWVILEPVDECCRPVPVGEPSHSVLLTNLANQVQPLIRYDLGDQITVHTQTCPCGSTLPVIEVRGRRDDSLLMAGLDGKPVTLLPLALTTVLEDEAGVFDFQLRQRDQHTLELVLGAPHEQGGAVAKRCRDVLENFATLQGLAPISIIERFEPNLTKGRSGKSQRVIVLDPASPS